MNHEIIVGWHGTLEGRMKKILEENFNLEMFTKKNGRPTLPGDLGYGTYLFIEDSTLGYNAKEHTVRFAKQYKDRPKENIKLLKVEVINKNLLDLDDEDNLHMFYDLKRTLKQQVEKRAKELAINGTLRRGNFDGLYIETIITYLKEQEDFEIKLVSKRTFTNFKEKVALLKVNVSNFPNGKELAIRDIDLVVNIEEEVN